MTIDWKRPIETTDGRPARVLATDVRDIDTAVGVRVCVLVDYGRHELPILTRSDGTNDLRVPLIRNKRTKREGWVNLYSSGGEMMCAATIFPTRELADVGHGAMQFEPGRKRDCIRIEWEE